MEIQVGEWKMGQDKNHVSTQPVYYKEKEYKIIIWYSSLSATWRGQVLLLGEIAAMNQSIGPLRVGDIPFEAVELGKALYTKAAKLKISDYESRISG